MMGEINQAVAAILTKLWTFPAASPREQTFHPNMFVEIRPLDRIPIAE
jgi:hypothetical protein